MTTISSAAGFHGRAASGRLLGAVLVLLLTQLLPACTTTYKDFENPRATPEITDDRPLVAFNQLMNETLPLAQNELEQEGASFRPKAFALSRQGGVRPVTIMGNRAQSDDSRIALLFDSLEIMTRGDDIVAFVVYAAGAGYLVNTPTQDHVLIAHMEHHSGRAVLRRLSYSTKDGRVHWGAEDVDGIEGVVFTGPR